MNPETISKFEDIVDYISKETDDECTHSINGLYDFYHGMAEKDQKKIIEGWVEEWWAEVKDCYIDDYNDQFSNFEQLPVFSKFVYKNNTVCKVPKGKTYVAIDSGGNEFHIDKDTVIETYYS
jgi:hypothetical protein